jgi:hypothetical protein
LLIFSAIDASRDTSKGGLFWHHKQWALLRKRWANPTLSYHSWAVLPYWIEKKRRTSDFKNET